MLLSGSGAGLPYVPPQAPAGATLRHPSRDVARACRRAAYILSDDDVESVIAFLDSLPPVRNPLPKTRLHFVAASMIKSNPQTASKVLSPDRGNPKEYGQFRVALGGCQDCHKPSDAHGSQFRTKTSPGDRLSRRPSARW